MPAPAAKLASGKPFSEAYVLRTAGFRPVRRHSAELPFCTKPVSGGNAEETEMKLSSVLLATAVLGAALVASSEPAGAYHYSWHRAHWRHGWHDAHWRYGWHRAPYYSYGWGSTYPNYSFGYNYPYSVTMAAAETAPLMTGRSVATGQEYYSVVTGQEYGHFYPMVTARGLYYAPGTPVLDAQGPVTATGTYSGQGAPPPIMWSSSGMVPNEPLLTGRSVAVGAVGNHCLTPVTTCLLYHSSTQGRDCACKVTGRWRHGTVAP
jgi:hypothetical protein